MRQPPTATKLYISQTHKLFYCNCKIKIPYGFDEDLLEEAFQIMKTIDLKYNSYQTNSFFDKINKNSGEWVETDSTTVDLITILKLVAEVTEGAYDITITPLIKLWGFYDENRYRIPSAEEVSNVLKNIDFTSIKTEQNRVMISKGQEIITASFIKAFAVDQAIDFLVKNNVDDLLINAGGSTIRTINNESNKHWSVNIPNPLKADAIMDKIIVNNQCFSLSGKVNNHLMIDGRKYGHILNAKTGFPTHSAQVGVVTENALLGDIISTALSSISFENVEKTAEKLRLHFDFSYYRIEDNGEKIEHTCQ